MKNRFKKGIDSSFRWNDNRGQVLTEYLIILIILIVVVFVHIQFSLNYVIAHVSHYATFMAARVEAVRPGSYTAYLDPFVKLTPIPPTPSVSAGKIGLGYQVVSPLPFAGNSNFFNLTSESPFSHEPQANSTNTQGELDNEIP